MNLIEKLMDNYLLPNKHFQDYINNRYNREGFTPIDNKFLENAVTEYKGFKWQMTERINRLAWAEQDYDISDLRPDDVVLDIGAEFGAFAIPVSKKCNKVCCVEIDPNMVKLLVKNVVLNNINNINYIGCGLTGNEELFYDLHKGNGFSCLPLRKIINLLRFNPTFLKLDCESAEWSIKPEELGGIRRIEAEVHNLKGLGIASGKGNRNLDDWLKLLDISGFEYTYEKYQDIIMKVHARRR